MTNNGNIFLTKELQKSLNDLLEQWKNATEARGKALNISIEEEELSNQQLNSFPSLSDEETDVQFFSLDASEKSSGIRALNEWSNRALRSAKILRQSISKGLQLASEKKLNLIKELKPPSSPETEKIPILTIEQLQDDNIVLQYVTSLKKHRFLWRKLLTSQKRRLRSGFEFEQMLVGSICKLSVSAGLPCLLDYLQKEYKGAEQQTLIKQFKMDFIRDLLSSVTAPSRLYLYEVLWERIISFVVKDPKVLDVITITVESKSCTLFDFRASLLYKEAISFLPGSTTLIEGNIRYFQERLSPKSQTWDYLPKGILPRLLSIHLEWISAAGFAFDSEKIWISAIDLHMRAGDMETAKKLLTVVQQLPLKNLKSITVLANREQFRGAFPRFKTLSTIPSALQSIIKRRTQFQNVLSNVGQIYSEEQVKKLHATYQSECTFFLQDEKRTPPQQKKLLQQLGIDPILFLYHEGFLLFSKFSNQMEYSLHYLQLYKERLITLLESESTSEQIQQKYRPIWMEYLKSAFMRLADFAAFPSTLEMQLKLASIAQQFTVCLKQKLHNPEWLVGVLARLLHGLSKIYTAQTTFVLVNEMVELAGPESHEHIPIIRSVFENATTAFRTALSRNLTNTIITRAIELWNSWIRLETRLCQFYQVMKCFEEVLAQTELRNNIDLWLHYAQFCVQRGKLDNCRIVYCRAVCHFEGENLHKIWNSFLHFEQNEGGNPRMTKNILTQLVQQKIRNGKKIDSPSTNSPPPSESFAMDVDKRKVKTFPTKSTPEAHASLHINNQAETGTLDSTTDNEDADDNVEMTDSAEISTNHADSLSDSQVLQIQQDNSVPSPVESPIPSPIPSPISSPVESPVPSPPPISIKETRSTPPEQAKATKLTGKRKISPTKHKNPEKKQKVVTNKQAADPLQPSAKQHDANFKLNETLVQALVNPAPSRSEASLLALEQIQRELLRNKKIQKLIESEGKKASQSGGSTPPNPVPSPAPNPSQVNPSRVPHISREEIERITAPTRRAEEKSKGRTILLQEPPPPTRNFGILPNHYQQYPAAPPLLQFPPEFNISMVTPPHPHAEPRPTNAMFSSNTPPPAPIDVSNVDWTTLLQDEAIIGIVRHLYDLQQLSERNIEKRRRHLQDLHKEQEKQILHENTVRLNTARSSSQYQHCKADNMERIKNFKHSCRQQLVDFEAQVKREQQSKITEQQITLQHAGIPGFFPTNDEKFIQVQTQILGLLFKIGSRK